MTGDIFKNNTAQSRYELHVGAHVAYASYRRTNQTLYIDYVEAPPELRGTGAAGQLMSRIVDDAKALHLDIVPICGYAAAWLRRNLPNN